MEKVPGAVHLRISARHCGEAAAACGDRAWGRALTGREGGVRACGRAAAREGVWHCVCGTRAHNNGARRAPPLTCARAITGRMTSVPPLDSRPTSVPASSVTRLRCVCGLRASALCATISAIVWSVLRGREDGGHTRAHAHECRERRRARAGGRGGARRAPHAQQARWRPRGRAARGGKATRMVRRGARGGAWPRAARYRAARQGVARQRASTVRPCGRATARPCDRAHAPSRRGRGRAAHACALAHAHLIGEDAALDWAVLLRAQPAEALLLVRQHRREQRRRRLALSRPRGRHRLRLGIRVNLLQVRRPAKPAASGVSASTRRWAAPARVGRR
eukprot:7378666-Prymnesium_polylepis.1